MSDTLDFVVNGRAVSVACDGTVPLLTVLRDELGLRGSKFGCGTEQCGACMVLIDGKPGRAPWIDLGDLRAKGAVVVWTNGADPRVLPLEYRSIAEDAEIQEPFELPVRLGTRTVTVAWAVLRPRPVVAEAR